MEISISDFNDSKYDHENIEIDGKFVGFIGKQDLSVGLQRCPECDSENYAMNVMNGNCYQCGFDLKDLVETYLNDNPEIKDKLEKMQVS